MRHLLRNAALGMLAAVLATGIALADGTWVAADGDLHKLRHGGSMFFGEDGAEHFDLAELADGETRTFGSGNRAVTARRSGESVTISRAASGDDVSVIDVTCDISRDSCTVVTFPDDAEKVMIAIEKERVCVDGEGDCNDFTFGDAVDGHIVVDIDCDGEDCEELHELHKMHLDELHKNITVETVGGDDGERIVIRRIGTAGDDGENVFVTRSGSATIDDSHAGHGNRVLLRCPEGDATLTVDKEEQDDTFLCPKHSSPMEKVQAHRRGPVRVIRRGSPNEH